MIVVKRCRDADQDGVHPGDLRVVRSRAEAMLLGTANLLWSYANNVGPSTVEGLDFGGINVETGNRIPLFGEQQCKRQTNISETDDPDAGGPVLKLLFDFRERARSSDKSGHGCPSVYAADALETDSALCPSVSGLSGREGL